MLIHRASRNIQRSAFLVRSFLAIHSSGPSKIQRNLFTPTDIEDAVRELDVFRNDILGAAAFFAGLAALQFPKEQVASIATTAFLFIVVWGGTKISRYKAAHDRLYAGYGRIAGSLGALARNFVLFLGLLFLGFIAGGDDHCRTPCVAEPGKAYKGELKSRSSSLQILAAKRSTTNEEKS